mgnify:CR=1 FL=1|tara:strand:+ start:751 stop:1008 length:258 start_codon:yes stop_codon:yes gene_type:complete
MSVRSAILGSAIGIGLSGVTFSFAFDVMRKLNDRYEVNDEGGGVATITRLFRKYWLEKLANGIVLGCGIYGFYHGYNNNIRLLKN